jgi:hypothetical protein
MDEPIEDAYFNWLCAKVLSIEVPIYWDLMRILHSTEFVYLVDGDDNRAEEGLELRYRFLVETQRENEQAWYTSPVSVLEVLIAFAQRANFQTDAPTRDWFWIFLQNLNLDEYRQVSPSDVNDINDILHDFVWRQYNDSGHGGMFPLRWPQHNQRKLEIWYQFCEYLDENDLY